MTLDHLSGVHNILSAEQIGAFIITNNKTKKGNYSLNSAPCSLRIQGALQCTLTFTINMQ